MYGSNFQIQWNSSLPFVRNKELALIVGRLAHFHGLKSIMYFTLQKVTFPCDALA
jgi:hypothetical protein